MGSRVMHAIIAVEVAKRVRPLNVTDFVIGSIAPDAISNKEVSHFFTGDADAFTREVNYKKFWQEHGNVDSDYLIGYYCHLVADEKWLNGFYSTWLKKLVQLRPEMQAAYLNDFKLLNKMLLEDYPDTLEIINHLTVSKEIDIVANITCKDVESLLYELIQDAREWEKGELQVFTYDAINAYIHSCVDRIAYFIQHLE